MWAKVKPWLTTENMHSRLKFARHHVSGAGKAEVHLDEKMFRTWKRSGKCKVPNGDPVAYEHIASKTKPPGLMVIAVGARPVPRKNFDGKIMIRRVAKQGLAKKKSKYRNKGVQTWQGVAMDAAMFREIMEHEIVPAICNKMPWCSTVVVQADGAKCHFDKPKGDSASNLDYLNDIGPRMRRSRCARCTGWRPRPQPARTVRFALRACVAFSFLF